MHGRPSAHRHARLEPPLPARLVVLASGAGTTLQALLEAERGGRLGLGAQIVAVGADREDAHALRRATSAGIPTFVVRLADHPDRGTFDAALVDAVAAAEPDLVVLAGFMKILGPAVVRRFRIVNTHPSLLPAFPGAHAVRDALAAGVTESGVTVHVVDEGVDTGPPLAQARVPVLPGDDEDALRARIQAVERELYVDVVARLVRDGWPDSALSDQAGTPTSHTRTTEDP